jgi:hypothetical protein
LVAVLVVEVVEIGRNLGEKTPHENRKKNEGRVENLQYEQEMIQVHFGREDQQGPDIGLEELEVAEELEVLEEILERW